jgi:hypothetical protein
VAGGVHHEKKVFGSQAVKKEIIDHPSLVVEQKAVVPLSIGKFGRIVGEEGFEGGEGSFPTGADLAHVGDVKKSGGLAGGFVLGK